VPVPTTRVDARDAAADVTAIGTPQESVVEMDVLTVVSAKDDPGVALISRIVGTLGVCFAWSDVFRFVFCVGSAVVVWGVPVDAWGKGEDGRECC
jgi:hypothetical protein